MINPSNSNSRVVNGEDFKPLIEKLFTKKQLSESLSLSESYINKLMAEEGLPHIKIGRAVRYRLTEVLAWLQKRSQP